MDERKKVFGTAVRMMREHLGFDSRASFAQDVGLSQRTLAAVELGEEGAGGRKSRAVIARRFGWEPLAVEQYLAGITDEFHWEGPAPALPPTLQKVTEGDPGEDWLTASRAELMARAETLDKETGDPRIADAWLAAVLARRQEKIQAQTLPESNAQ